jgi:hypothetical protein
VRTGRLALTAVPAAAYVVVMALVAALWVKPPLLGWIGAGIVAVVGAAVTIAAPALFACHREPTCRRLATSTRAARPTRTGGSRRGSASE